MEENTTSLTSMVNWVGTSVASAFFASMERFSCVNVSTTDEEEENEEEAKDRPLMLTKVQNEEESVVGGTNQVTEVADLPV